MSPVLVLTRGQRLILVLIVFIGTEEAFEPLSNLLWEAELALPEGCVPLAGCLLLVMAAFRRNLVDTPVIVVMSPGFRSRPGPLVEDWHLAFCCAVTVLPLTFTLLATPNGRLAGCVVAWAATAGTFLPTYLHVSTEALFSFPSITYADKKTKIVSQ